MKTANNKLGILSGVMTLAYVLLQFGAVFHFASTPHHLHSHGDASHSLKSGHHNHQTRDHHGNDPHDHHDAPSDHDTDHEDCPWLTALTTARTAPTAGSPALTCLPGITGTVEFNAEDEQHFSIDRLNLSPSNSPPITASPGKIS